MTQRALKAHQEEGLVDMVIGRDNLKLQPQPVHRQQGSNLVLMRSEFAPRHIVKELARLEDRLLDKKRQSQGFSCTQRRTDQGSVLRSDSGFLSIPVELCFKRRKDEKK